MNSTQRSATRRVRTVIVTALAGGIGMTGLLGLGGVAQASTHARTDGFVVMTSCTGVQGKITYSPGLLTSKLRSVHATLTGTTSGCSNIFDGALAGTGTMTAILSGKASVNKENFTGTFTINWPAGSGFNPSNGTLSVTEANGLETISGSVTSGFETSSAFAMQYVTTSKTGKGTTAKPVTAQNYVNTQQLSLSENEG